MAASPLPSVGILTFHCSDNCGAMLQAYALRQFLRSVGFPTQIVPYEPFYLTGRHWLVPYFPTWNPLPQLLRTAYLTLAHLRAGREFFLCRKTMRAFRKQLLDPGQRPFHTEKGLGSLPYACYVVGSDQIWNPDITFGLRPAYFGAFQAPAKKRVVAYAASYGQAALPPGYEKEFSQLISGVDAVSMREAEALPYVRGLYKGPVSAVLDPVFLIDPKEWKAVEEYPTSGEYILIYTVKPDEALAAYARELSARTGLPIVGPLCAGSWRPAGTTPLPAAGPGQLLGGIHRARYVVTNSFHGTSLSIIFRRPFVTFPHSAGDARINNILKIHGLENRLYQEGFQMDAPINWDWAEAARVEALETSKTFLVENLRLE